MLQIDQTFEAIYQEHRLLLKNIQQVQRRVRECMQITSGRGRNMERLPIEVCGQIFASASIDSSQSALHILHVCQAWRSVALSTPEMWTCNDHKSLQIMRLFLGRSKLCLVDLTVHIRSPQDFDQYEDAPDEVDAEIALMIKPHSERWRTLSICAYDGNRVKSVLDLLRVSELHVPQLERMCLRSDDHCVYFDDTFLLPFPFHAAPRLHQVTLNPR